MTWDQIQGERKHFSTQIQKEERGIPDKDDQTKIAERRDRLAGLLQERYGYDKEQAETEVIRAKMEAVSLCDSFQQLSKSTPPNSPFAGAAGSQFFT